MAKRQQNISKKNWLYVSLAGFIITFFLILFFIFFPANIVKFGFTKSLYYIILIPAGLCSAAFLFGAMRSYAKYTGENKFGKLELTGPVVLFCLVIIGGFVFAEPESTFTLTIRLENIENREKIISQGELLLDIGKQRLRREIDKNGEVIFSDLNTKYLDNEIRIIPRVEGFQSASTNPIIIPENKIIYFSLKHKFDSTIVRGTIINNSGQPVSGVLLNFESGLVSCITDSSGNFTTLLPFPAGASILLNANYKNSLVYRDFITIPKTKSLTIKIN